MAFFLSLSATALFGAVVADDDLPDAGGYALILDGGGTAGSPAQYVVGQTPGYTLEVPNDSLYLGVDKSYNSLTLQSGGKLTSYGGFLGSNSNSNYNSVTVTGSGSTWTNTYQVWIGDSGSYNSLVIENGGEVLSPLTHIGSGETSDYNSVTVRGTGSKWTISKGFIVGSSGSDNSLTISDGGSVTAALTGTIGNSTSSADNVVTVTGATSSWSVGSTLTVGAYGQSNSLVIQNGGKVTSALGVIGQRGEATGNSVTVSGKNSQWTMTGDFETRAGANSSLSILAGGRVENYHATVGSNAFSEGASVLVSGKNSTWMIKGDLDISPLNNASNNSVTILDRGLVIVDGALSIGSSLVPTVDDFLNLDGGFLAWKGDKVSALEAMIAGGTIRGFVDGTWQSVDASHFNLAFLADEAAALDFTSGLYGSLAGYTVLTTFSAIPEPGTTAAIFGVVALAGVWWHRSRREKRNGSATA